MSKEIMPTPEFAETGGVAIVEPDGLQNTDELRETPNDIDFVVDAFAMDVATDEDAESESDDVAHDEADAKCEGKLKSVADTIAVVETEEPDRERLMVTVAVELDEWELVAEQRAVDDVVDETDGERDGECDAVLGTLEDAECETLMLCVFEVVIETVAVVVSEAELHRDTDSVTVPQTEPVGVATIDALREPLGE